MIKGREHPACTLRRKDVVVIGGESGKHNGMEVLSNHDGQWSYSTVDIGATGLQMLSRHTNIYIFGGYEGTKLTNKVWKMDKNNIFTEVGSTLIARRRYDLFPISRGFLKTCEGMYIYLNYLHDYDVSDNIIKPCYKTKEMFLK